MKSKFTTIIALVALALFVTSCYSSRRSRTGCPMNVKTSTQAEKAGKAA